MKTIIVVLIAVLTIGCGMVRHPASGQVYVSRPGTDLFTDQPTYVQRPGSDLFTDGSYPEADRP